MGMGITIKAQVKEVILADSVGLIYKGRPGLNSIKEEMAKQTNSKKIIGEMPNGLVGTDVFIGVSQANILTQEMITQMNPDPIIFAMANPIPEIMPELAYAAGAKIVGTGRSDLPNQINNALVFPGLFRGILDGKIKKVTPEMKMATAIAIAHSIKPTLEQILPSVLDKKVVKNIKNIIMKFSLKK